MGATMDLLIPPVILAMLIGMIFSTNVLVMESSVENRVTFDLQSRANNTLLIVQEEVRGLRELLTVTDDTLRYISFERDTVTITKQDRTMVLSRKSPDGTPAEEELYPISLGELTFGQPGLGTGNSSILQVKVVTESLPEQEAVRRNFRYKAVAEREIYLRNLDVLTQ